MIPLERIALLAELYDLYNNALDPFSEKAVEAKRDFDKLIDDLHSTHAPEISFLEFRYEVIRHCREYLRKN